MKILIIEDDKDLVAFLKPSLKSEGFLVDHAEDGNTGESLLLSTDYDLIILDLNIPNKNGIEICEEIRGKKKETLILILTANNETENKIRLLNMGADDYLTKPFSFEELVARMRALLRRPKNIESTNIIEIQNIKLDKSCSKVTQGTKEVYLTLKEFSLLEYLMENKGKTVSRGMLIDHVWDMAGNIFSNTIEAHIFNLRKKLGNSSLIITVPGRGYKIN